MLESSRGARGGFRLARPADRVSVEDVLLALEGGSALAGCVMGFPTCDANQPCPMHDAWSAVKAQMEASMISTTIADLRRAALVKAPRGKGPAARAKR